MIDFGARRGAGRFEGRGGLWLGVLASAFTCAIGCGGGDAAPSGVPGDAGDIVQVTKVLPGPGSSGGCSSEGSSPGGAGAECDSPCLDWTPLTDDAGQVECRVLVRTTDLGECPSEAGWVDPTNGSGERAERLVDTAEGEVRVCEVVQLEGAALSSCRTDPACTDCEGGFCFVSPLLRTDQCPTWRDLRILGGGATAPLSYEVTCNGERNDD